MPSLFHRLFWPVAAMLTLVSCQPQGTTTVATATPVSIFSAGDYRAGAADVLKVTVYDEPDLSGEYMVGPDGKIALPLVGAVPVAGLTLAQLPDAIANAYRDGYLLDPKVSVELKSNR